MIAFCPNCGSQNSGLPGTRTRCAACASPFDVPPDERRPSTPAGDAPRRPGFFAPGAQVFSPVPGAAPMQQGRTTNTLAIVSLVAGLVCCIPFVSPAVAIVGGIVAVKQIDASAGTQDGRSLAIAGVVVGVLTALLQFFWLVGTLSRQL